MIKQNKSEFDYLGITRFHKAGYLGQGIKVTELEGANPNLDIFEGKLKDPFDIYQDSRIDVHGQFVFECIHQGMPKADLFALPNGHKTLNGKVSGLLVEKTLPFIEENNIHFVGASLGGNDNKELENKIIKLKKRKPFITFVTSAGNHGNDEPRGYASTKPWIPVGAIGYRDQDGTIYYKSYSSVGNKVRFTCFSGIYVHNIKHNATVIMEGTSFSSPMFINQLGLIQCFFLQNVGRVLTEKELINFVMDHIQDLGPDGKDIKYGNGLLILPDPYKIDIKKYIQASKEGSFFMPDKEVGDIEFSDIRNCSEEGKKAIQWAVDEGLFKGYPDGTFKPKNNVTREELAIILKRQGDRQ